MNEDMTPLPPQAVPAAEFTSEKIMTLSQSEFAHSISSFVGQEAGRAAAASGLVKIPIGQGEVAISFTKIEGFSFGGLVEMPRARVEIAFFGVSKTEADAFMRRFEISFQRGGG